MARGHTPLGYRIKNGRAEICESEVRLIKEIYSGYLSGLGYMESARRAGLKMNHGCVKRLMRNRHYLGMTHILPLLTGNCLMLLSRNARGAVRL